jgi:hypothetical protein
LNYLVVFIKMSKCKSQPSKPTTQRTSSRKSSNQSKAVNQMIVARATAPRISGFVHYNNNNAFPTQLRRKLRYSSIATVTGSATVGLLGNVQKYSLNSLFDPDVTGVGHQPYAFDQLCTSTGPYSRYKVIGCKVKVTAVSPGDPVFLYTQLVNPVETYDISNKDVAEASEKPAVRVDYIPSTGPQCKVINFNIPNLSALFQWDKATFDLDMGQTTGPYNGSPGTQCYLAMTAAYPTVASRNLDIFVELEFDTIFYDRYTLATS